MIEQESRELCVESPNILERIAQSIIIAYGWVAGPGMTEQERIKRELAETHPLAAKLHTTDLMG